MEKRKKTERIQKFFFGLLMFLFMAVCGGVGGYMIATIQEKQKGEGALGVAEALIAIGAVLFLVAIAWIIHIYVHETGHLIFGLLTGYRFQSIRFGSLMFIKTEEGIQCKRLTLAGTGGQCLMLPPKDKGDDYPTTLYNLGGCLANLFVALLCLVCYLFTNRTSIGALLLLLLSLVGIGSALLNGVPMSSLSNDGYNMLVLRKDIKARRALRIQFEANACLAQGQSIKDMPEEWFEWEQEIPENNLVAAQGVLRFNYLMECRRIEEARALGGFLLENAAFLANVHELLLKMELIYCDMLLGEDKEAIKKKFQKEKKQLDALKSLPSTQRFYYTYYLLVEEDEAKAEKCQEQFEKIAKKYPYPVEMDTERELMAKAADLSESCKGLK